MVGTLKSWPARWNIRRQEASNIVMARGFDSKSVEEQQSLSLVEKPKKPKETLTSDQQVAKRERANLELARTKLRNDLAASTNERHRQMIEAALKDVEKKLTSST